MRLFTPRVSIRSPSTSYFAELYQSAGPQRIGETGRGTTAELFGWDWLALIDRENILRAYQRDDSHEDGWVEVEERLPPIFGSALPAEARRLSLAFDQSARACVAYELGGIIRVTRWSASQQEYVQNVSFPGTNPVLVVDAIVGIPVGDSDVLLFYQRPDEPESIQLRVQRQIYAEEHTMFTHSEGLILDRVEFLDSALQVLVSTEDGHALTDAEGNLIAIRSDDYPMVLADAVRSHVQPVRARYEQLVFNTDGNDAVRSRATLINLPGKNTPIGPQGYAMSGAPGTAFEGEWEADLEKNIGIGAPNCQNVTEVVASGGYLSGPEIDWVSPAYDVSDFYGFGKVRIDARITWYMLMDSFMTPTTNSCTVQNYSSASRRVIAEFGAGPTSNPADVPQWHEIGTYSGRHSDRGEPPVNTEHVFQRAINLLAEGRHPFAFARIRIEAVSSLGGTGVGLSSVPMVHVLPLTNAYVGNIAIVRATDAVRSTVTPIARYVSNITLATPADAVRSDVRLAQGEYVHAVVAHAMGDAVRSDVQLARAEYRKV